MHLKKMLWIVNPHAGRGAMRGKLIDCILAFQQAGFDVTLHVTEGPEDATRVAKVRAGEFDRIVCAGGDGTLNEVVTGLMQSEVRPPLGYIPAGTTNDFATSLGIPKVPADAAVIAAGENGDAVSAPQGAFGVFAGRPCAFLFLPRDSRVCALLEAGKPCSISFSASPRTRGATEEGRPSSPRRMYASFESSSSAPRSDERLSSRR